jgi:hypothetical protein
MFVSFVYIGPIMGTDGTYICKLRANWSVTLFTYEDTKKSTKLVLRFVTRLRRGVSTFSLRNVMFSVARHIVGNVNKTSKIVL